MSLWSKDSVLAHLLDHKQVSITQINVRLSLQKARKTYKFEVNIRISRILTFMNNSALILINTNRAELPFIITSEH